MRRMRIAAAALIMGASAAAAQDSADIGAIRQVLTAYAEFAQAKNIAGMDTLVASDGWVHIIEGAGVNHGWADYRDNHISPELEHFDNFRYRYFAIEPQVRNAIAWAPFRYELSAETERGPLEMEGRGTAVLEKRGARWTIVHLHTSGRRRSSQ